MNSCILMAEVVQEPQLRFTPDQVPIAEMLVQFPGLRAEDAPATLKVVGWGNLAQTIQETYHLGDRVIVEGRLSMNTIDRPEGFKEKRAELTAQRIHRLGTDAPYESYATTTVASAVDSAPVTSMDEGGGTPAPSKSSATPKAPAASPNPYTAPAIPQAEPDYDDIPF